MYLTMKTALAERSITKLKEYIRQHSPLVKEFFISPGGLQTIRILSFYPGTEGIISREFSWSRTDPTEDFAATIWLWRETESETFANRVLGIDLDLNPEEPWLDIFHYDKRQEMLPMASIDRKGVWGVHLSFGNDLFYGLDNFGPETWFKEGHLFVQAIFRILNRPSMSLVHGACIGRNGSGILMCARGGGGKSTLSVMAMLQGFEFVSDDYLVLEKGTEGVFASPVYSFITLSPQMYETMYDNLDKARFLGNSPWRGKYVLDISGYKKQLRYHYPVCALLFPEIDLQAAKPSIIPCSSLERGKTIVQIAHSTISQMCTKGLQAGQRDSDFILKTVKMLEGLDCYRIKLSPDLDANVECLGDFINTVK